MQADMLIPRSPRDEVGRRCDLTPTRALRCVLIHGRESARPGAGRDATWRAEGKAATVIRIYEGINQIQAPVIARLILKG
jgi:hypothetical protein